MERRSSFTDSSRGVSSDHSSDTNSRQGADSERHPEPDQASSHAPAPSGTATAETLRSSQPTRGTVEQPSAPFSSISGTSGPVFPPAPFDQATENLFREPSYHSPSPWNPQRRCDVHKVDLYEAQGWMCIDCVMDAYDIEGAGQESQESHPDASTITPGREGKEEDVTDGDGVHNTKT